MQIGSPPLARGVHWTAARISYELGITPACAGSTSSINLFFSCFWDHPRLRGEYEVHQTVIWLRRGSPPLARGVQTTRQAWDNVFRITPACAGSTLQNHLHFQIHRDHPRLRGEYYCVLHIDCELAGSPPLARGVHLL